MNLKEPIRSAIPYSRGNVKPLLNEIIHALDRLLSDDEPTALPDCCAAITWPCTVVPRGRTVTPSTTTALSS